MDAANIIGTIASVAMILGYLPQAIYTMRTGNTDGISMTGFLMMLVGSIGFFTQGLILGNIPLWVTNAITSVSSLIVLVIKIRNDRSRPRRKS